MTALEASRAALIIAQVKAGESPEDIRNALILWQC